uniref:Ribonuclease H-like domain-containing protein n=1 Tax=Tanacetum cinerariifolium TaxID=118510 RepID=A0A699HX59_TANCI|nr:ribonuclease H-like domain-containing protein [Tanacetum cinerariifolium]
MKELIKDMLPLEVTLKEAKSHAKDETSAILKTFITGIENLIDHKVKVIRCDNGTQFENREMNQFCEMKGKFDGKADEGFFVGYSLNSKAVRVFNNRTRIVEENLHIRFSENTPNITRSGPNWLFDIDTLTKSMNYKPVVAGNQSNGNACTKACDDADPRQESKCKDQEKEDNINITNNVNVAGINRVNVVGENTNNQLPFDLEIPALEAISTFNFSSDHVDNDEMADMNNLDITIQISPTPTTRIHKDHPIDQMDVKSVFLYGNIEEENVSTPTETQKPLLKDEDGKEVDVHMNRLMIGSLMYLTSSRPDIMFEVCACARYQLKVKRLGITYYCWVDVNAVEDEDVNKEMDDSLERAATSLDLEPDRGFNTPQSGEDSQQLNELMELCTKLQQRVLNLETIKTTQALEIESLKRRVKKLEMRKWPRTHGLKRLYKVGLSARVESSKDEDMFGVNDVDGDEVIVESVDVAEQVKEVVDDITLAKALMEIKSAKTKADKVVIQEQKKGITTTITAASLRLTAKGLVVHEQEQAPTPTVSSQQPSQVKDKGKGKMVEPEHVKKLSKKIS